jgi:hypothetical protein
MNDLSSGMLRCEVWQKLTDVSEMITASVIVLIMEDYVPQKLRSVPTTLDGATQKTVIFEM